MKHAAFVLCLAACGADPGGVPPDAAPSPDAGPPSAVDLLFVIEDSPDVSDQANLAMNVPVLIDALQHAPSGSPDLHLAIITTSMGAGAFTSSVPRCGSPGLGNFVTTLHCATDPACQTNRLDSGEHFFIDGQTRNYSGELATAVACMLLVGIEGCGFKHHLAALRAALGDPQQGIDAPDGNAGFLRPNARLAVIILAEEDDCSVPSDSLLFDPNQTSVSDPLGPLSYFRCVEFGDTCDGLTANNGRIPRAPGGPYHNCRPNDAYAAVDPQHSLIPSQVFIDYLRRIKQDVVVAAIAGNTEPFAVFIDQQTGFPALGASCNSSSGIFGFPPVRLNKVVSSLGAHGLMAHVCENSYADAYRQIANLIMTP